MVRGIEMIGQRKWALPMAIVCIVARWGHNPVAPAHIRKVHIERMPSAILVVSLATRWTSLMTTIPAAPIASASTPVATPTASTHITYGARLVLAIVGVGEQQRLLVLPHFVRFVRAAAQAHMMMRCRLEGTHRANFHQQSVVLLRCCQPPIHSGLHIQTDRFGAVQPHRLRIEQQIARLPMPPDTDTGYVIDQHLVPCPITIRRLTNAERLARQLQLGGLQLLLGGNALHIEVQPKPMMMWKPIVDFTICKSNGKKKREKKKHKKLDKDSVLQI